MYDPLVHGGYQGQDISIRCYRRHRPGYVWVVTVAVRGHRHITKALLEQNCETEEPWRNDIEVQRRNQATSVEIEIDRRTVTKGQRGVVDILTIHMCTYGVVTCFGVGRQFRMSGSAWNDELDGLGY